MAQISQTWQEKVFFPKKSMFCETYLRAYV